MTNLKRFLLSVALLVCSPIAWIAFFARTSGPWSRFAIAPYTFEGFMGSIRIQLAVALPDLIFFSILGVVCVLAIRLPKAWIWALCVSIVVVIVRSTLVSKARFGINMSQHELLVAQFIEHLLPILVSVISALLFMKWRNAAAKSPTLESRQQKNRQSEGAA